MKTHADTRLPLTSWKNETEEVSWHNPQDIKDRYSNASFLDDNIVFFNIKGKHYRLRVQVDYEREIVIVKWIGTHAEYTKKYC